MRSKLAWLAFAILLAVGAYGYFHEGLHRLEAWYPEGWRRFRVYTSVYWIWALALLTYRPAMLAPLTIAGAAFCGIWWLGPVAVVGPALFLGSCFLVGKRIAPRAEGVIVFLLGLSAWIFAVSLAVHFPINTRPLYFAVLAIPYIFGWRDVLHFCASAGRHLRGSLAESPRPPVARTLAAAVLLFVLVAHFLIALKPDIGADSLAMHLAAPMTVEYERKWDFDHERFVWALMPMGADWAYTAALLLSDAAGVRLLNFATLVLLSLLIRDAARRWVSDNRATLAAALFASTPLVQLATGNVMVENMWAAMTVAGLIVLIDGELLWAGVLIGTALSVKFGTAALLVPVLVVGAVIAVRDKKSREAIIGVLLMVILAAPTYATAWYRTGNPVYPFLNHVFQSPSFETTPAFVDSEYRKPLRWTTLYDLTFRTNDYYGAQKAGMGFQYFLLLIPSALLLRRRPQLLLFAITLFGGILAYLSQSNVRYLYPFLAAVSITIAEFPLGWGLVSLIALNLTVLPASGWNHREFALPTRAAEAAYLEQGHPQRKLIEYLNRNAPDQPAAFFGGDAIAGFHGRAYTDSWHTYGYVNALGNFQTANQLRAEWQRLGIHYVIAPANGRTSIYTVADEILRPLVASPVAVSGEYALFKLPEPAVGEYDDTDKSIRYSGQWVHSDIFPETLHKSISFSNDPGSALQFAFEGRGIKYWYTRAFNRGIAIISIDGKERMRLDLYSPQILWRQSTVLDGLGPGAHTIEIGVAPNKNPAASEANVDLDQFTVLP